MVVSEQDRIFHEKFVASCKIVVIPNFIDMSLYETRIERADYIVMSANFGANHNVVGLNWFLDHVWDDELANITRFVIAGLRSREALQERGGAWGVEALGEVDNIRDVIARAQCAVVPLLHGSGTRFKCIEAMALKIPLVSTSVGAEGLAHGGTILLADTPNSFKEALLNVLRRPQEHRVRTEVAYKICQELYSLTPNQQRLSDVLARCRRSDDGGSGH